LGLDALVLVFSANRKIRQKKTGRREACRFGEAVTRNRLEPVAREPLRWS
jgi:hypothetical protein